MLSAPAWEASPIETPPLLTVSTRRIAAPDLLLLTVPATVSATLSVSRKSPLVVLKAPRVPMLLLPPLVVRSTLPAVPVSVPTLSDPLWLTPAVVRRSSVAALPLRSIGAPMLMALLPAAPPFTAPRRSVVLLSPKFPAVKPSRAPVLTAPSTIGRAAVLVASSTAPPAAVIVAPPAPASSWSARTDTVPEPAIDSDPAWVASPSDTPPAAVSTRRSAEPELLFATLPATVSASASVNWKSPPVALNAPKTAMLLASVSVTLPAVPVSVPTVRVKPEPWVSAAVVRTSSVPARPVRSVAAPIDIALLPAAPLLTAPNRNVVADNPKLAGVKPSRAAVLVTPSTTGTPAVMVASSTAPPVAVRLAPAAPARS